MVPQTQKKGSVDLSSDAKEYRFPGVTLLNFVGYSTQYTHHHVPTGSAKLFGYGVNLLRRTLYILYLAACFIWMILFGICVFSYEVNRFHKDRAAGIARESDLIIKILDNVPWVATMVRNVTILALYSLQSNNIRQLSERLQNLLYLYFESDDRSFKSLVTASKKTLLISWIIILITSFMSLLHYFSVDLSLLAHADWDFGPLPMRLGGVQVTICLVVFTFVPFFLAQIVLISYVGTAAGGLLLLKCLNLRLKALRKPKPQLLLDSAPDYVEHPYPYSEKGPLGMYRMVHFQITNYINAVTKAASLTLLCAMGTDFAAAIGYVGLVIGKADSKNSVFPQYDRLYYTFSALCWAGFFLCGQYWAVIVLPEEAERTYHHLQGISLNPDMTTMASKHEQAEKELTYFILATKHTYLGIVAGKVLMFSRHMSVTITTLLLSYAILVYELIHRDRTTVSNVVETNKNVTKLIENFIGGNGSKTGTNRTL
ncbi:uncharacterized protein LOC129585989 isoform X2 [Paramacrobiotus metropolitanus]|uniref:uncharacterized protein LOC129585989 isoform X2 n=1 Tax=Paramacrobiotus metropolitanus TaxID=2943436 RepID=UPI0024461182|nr:uncharacterized protein LOC129585989 isoform X2 [Paramacrobiotus metropolitanus]